LAGGGFYVVYSAITGSEPEKKDEGNGDTKLKFVEVFINESSENYNKLF